MSDTESMDELRSMWWLFLSPIRESWKELDLGIVRDDPPLAFNHVTMFAEDVLSGS